jgi:hypothetical protein
VLRSIGFSAIELWVHLGHMLESNKHKWENLIRAELFPSFQSNEIVKIRDLIYFDSGNSAAPDQKDYFLYI